MLTPMLVQYLVGLCCISNNPDAVDITIGDMVLDTASETKRDIDITVTVKEKETNLVHAFKAYEVKKEKYPLDVAKVGELCNKFSDMPSITHKAIVSASGFSDAAQKKATKHGVDLFVIEKWENPIEQNFPNFGLTGLPGNSFPYSQTRLYWINFKINIVALKATFAFNVNLNDPIMNKNGKLHNKYPTWEKLKNELLLYSTEILYPLDQAQTILSSFELKAFLNDDDILATPAWANTHTLDISHYDAHINLNGENVRLDRVTISGYLQWQMKREKENYYLIRKISDSSIFAGASVSFGKREGQMFAFILNPNSKVIGIHIVQLQEKHLNAIRKLKLEIHN